MKHIDLFSGIGGFALATEIVWDNVEHIFCDNEPFAQAILKKHWPNAQIYGDIRQLKGNVSEPYILTGGFPCQPFSHAGVRRGTADDRYLWPEMLRVISEFRPRWVIAENVSGLLSIQNGMVFEQVCADLENEGYEVWPFVIPACSVGAPHRRDRVWIVGHSKNSPEREVGEIPQRKDAKSRGSDSDASDSTLTRGERGEYGKHREQTQSQKRILGRDAWREAWPEVATRLCTLDDGLRYDVVRPDGRRDAEIRPRPKGWRNAALKGAGNAIVPQVAAAIMNGIKHTDNLVQ